MSVEPVLNGSQHHGTLSLSLPLKPLGLEAHAQFSNSHLADLATRNPTSHATFGTKQTFPN